MDVVPAVFGAASGLAGLLLVFLGVSMSAFQSYAGDAPPGATARFRRAGGLILGAFLLGLVAVAVSFSWLLSPGRALRDVAVVLFAVELAATALAAVVTVRSMLWR
jgi:predicted GNAT superfamily acetyltransferase